MSKLIKGCINESCEAYKKKTKYRETDSFCLKCGTPLQFVCKKCHTVIDEQSKHGLCVRCEAKKEDDKEKAIKNGGKVLAVAGAVGGALLAGGKKALNVINSIKG